MPQEPQTPAYNVEDLSKQYGLDPDIMRKQIQQESGGKQSARSGAGAIGVMQLMPETAKRLGVDPYDEKQNVQGGFQEMGRLVQKYKGDYPKALAAYNAGDGPVDAVGGIPDYPETQKYVSSIMGWKPDDIKAQTPDGVYHVF